MTPHEALAEGRLADAIALAEAAAPRDAAARRLLADLYAFAGRLDDAAGQLDAIDSDDPDWQNAKAGLLALFAAERTRGDGRMPRFHPDPPSAHAIERWRAIEALRASRPEAAVEFIDAADAASPESRGFLDGQEFVGLRDADDRFASVLEVFVEGEYWWFAWESLRKVALAPPAVLLDQLYRAATLSRRDGSVLACHLPLVYPRSHECDGTFALGMETDHVCPDRGPTRCVGGKLLLVGDGVEVPLADCRMIEVR
jgi:type VI secretion system protein ImpE